MQLFDRFLRMLALASGAVMILLVLVTVTDVVMRYVFNKPLASAWEFTEFSMALIVFLGIAYCGWTGGHIAVDVFSRWLDRPSLRYLPAILSFIGAALFALIAYRAMLETITTFDQVSNTLRWPFYPFRFTVAASSAIFALVMVVQGIQSLSQPSAGKGQ
jgi:TRAP-type C4-dicarboxylate transport system permease small subunit